MKLKYTIHTENGQTGCKVVAVNQYEQITSDHIIQISQYCDQILQPLQLGVCIENIACLLISNCHLSYMPNIFQFSNLIELDISHNCFRNIPDFIINDNANLEKLNASFNKITNFNLSPKCYKKLKDLNLSNNIISEIPIWIFNSCLILENWNLSNNPLNSSGYLLSGKNLKKLHSLELNNCNINKHHKFLDDIPNLKRLSLTNCHSHENANTIHELPFGQFGSTNTLVELNLSQLGFSFLNDDIANLQCLEILNISYNYLSWLPEKFTSLKLLRIFNGSHNELLALPVDMGEMNSLVELHLSHNAIGTLPKSLLNLHKLEILDCYNNDLIDDAFDIIKQISSLTALDLEQNYISIKENEKYLEMQNNIWRNHESRIVGCKSDIIYDNDKQSYSSKSDEEVEQKCKIYNYDIKEENWDSDSVSSISNDSMLFLPTYKSKIFKKPVPYNPSDYIHPMYFEDALEDDT